MTPVFVCGAECQLTVVGGTTAISPHWDVKLGTAIAAETTLIAPSSGAASYKFNPVGGQASLKKTWPGAPGVGVGRFKFMQSVRPAVEAVIAIVGGPANPLFIRLGTTGVLRCTIGASTQNGPTIALNTWALIDFRITYNATTYVLDWYVDGVLQTQVTLAGQSSSTAGNFEVGVTFTSVTTTVYVDDIVLSNTSGDFPLGAGKTLGFVAGSDGTHTATGSNFLKNAAGAAITSGTTDAYQLVDEIPLGGGSDWINQAVAATGEYVELVFDCSAAPSAPRGVEAVVARHETNTNTVSAVFKLYDALGATEDDVLNYNVAAGNATLRYTTKQYAARPAALGAWTLAAFQALRFRFGYSNDATPDVYFDGVILEAEFPNVQNLTRTASESLTSADAGTRLFAGGRSLADALAAGDVAFRAGVFVRTTPDALGASVAAARAIGSARSVTDALASGDAATRGGAFLRSATDSTTYTDAAARLVGFVRTAVDAVGLSAVATRSGSFGRSSADATGFADAGTRSGTFLRSTADALGLAAVAAASKTFIRTAIDTLAATDAAGRAGAFLRGATDAATYSDAATRAAGFTRLSSDALALSVAAARLMVLGRTTSDALAVNAAASRAVAFPRATTDALGAGDVATRAGSFLRSLADALGLADAAVAARGAVNLARTAADAVTLAVTSSRAVAMLRAGSDALASSDAPQRVLGAARAASDALSASAVATTTRTLLRTAAEALTVDAMGARGVAFARAVADALHLDAAAVTGQNVARSVVDALHLADVVVAGHSIVRSVADAIAIADQARISLGGAVVSRILAAFEVLGRVVSSAVAATSGRARSVIGFAGARDETPSGSATVDEPTEGRAR